MRIVICFQIRIIFGIAKELLLLAVECTWGGIMAVSKLKNITTESLQPESFWIRIGASGGLL
jgi:hypothetical protein